MYQARLCSYLPLLMLFVLILPASADDYSGQVRYSTSDLSYSQKAGFDVIEMTGAGTMTVVGCPALPCTEVNVALPDGAGVIGVNLIDAEYVELAGLFDVIPAARPRRISNPATGNVLVKNQVVYGTDALFPGRLMEKMSQWELVGQEFVTVRIFPVQYNPVTGKAFLATKATFEVVYDIDPHAVRSTYNFSDRVRDHYTRRLENLALNPEAVELPLWNGNASRALSPGDYEYVIITTSSFEDDWGTLTDHYTKIGLPAKVVTTDWIYSNFSGSTNQAEIRNFVIDAHSTWGTIYFLLGGDSGKVPYHTKSLGGDNIPNDTYYADYDADYRVEVYLGRASVDTTSQISTFVSKVMDYMTGPPSGFGEEVFQGGFDFDSYTDGEDLMIYIDNNYVPSWADYDREYDSESGSHKSDFKGYINSGHSVTNHADHCNYNVLGVGSYNHGDHLYNSDASGFNNSGRAGIFYTLGCWPGAFEKNECWGEALVQNSGGGAISFVGNTRYGWYTQGSTNTYSCRYDKKFFKALWTNDYYRAGETLGESKNDYFPGDTTYKYVFTELTLLGDPGMAIWTDVPGTLSCTYSTTIDPGSQSYNVNVKSGGSNLSGALVCVYKGSQVYDRATTGGAGNATFTINPTDGGTMYVTVSAQNEKVHFGSCTVTGGGSPDLTCDLVLDSTTYQRLDWLNYDFYVYNNSGSSQSTFVWTNATLPNSNTYPPSGYIDGPIYTTVAAYGSEEWHYSRRIPGGAPYGNFIFNLYIGPNPGILDEDHEAFSIVP